uniref:HRDC domain-containing protein n=1 Tax=Candidatus Ventrenecus sp. TaxID=3085654 RepID=UPI003FEF3CFC
MRHKDILKKRWLSKNSSLLMALYEKNFDNLWFKPLVVLANSKSILDIKRAPLEIRKNTIRIDQLINYIKHDLSNYDKDLLTNANNMLKIANNFLENNTNDYCSLANKYNQSILNKLKDFRKEKAKEMNVPAYYIFNDEELNKIITLKPVTIEKLKEILPSIKVKIHGNDIIKILNESK